MNDICIRMENVYKEYTVADVKVQALNNVSFSVKKGEYIGYGANYIAKENMRIATIPIGYNDGIKQSMK